VTQDAHNAINLADNPFWRYSVSVYSKNNCADFLLHAQNTWGFDVNVLLFIGWLANQKRLFIVTKQHPTLITAFQKDITERIRCLRIKAKGFDNSKFYKALLDFELHAEYHQQARLISLQKLMPIMDLNYRDITRKGIENYIRFVLDLDTLGLKEMELNESQENNIWLQTLIEYLQPVS
jgi:uncharacterized protein (TIGR02444 family)